MARRSRPTAIVNIYLAPSPRPGASTESNSTEKASIINNIRKWCSPMIRALNIWTIVPGSFSFNARSNHWPVSGRGSVSLLDIAKPINNPVFKALEILKDEIAKNWNVLSLNSREVEKPRDAEDNSCEYYTLINTRFKVINVPYGLWWIQGH